MTGCDTRPLYAAIGPLHAEFPGWCFGVRPGYDGPRLEGYRPGCPAGLYAVITADPAEMRRELGGAWHAVRPAANADLPAAGTLSEFAAAIQPGRAARDAR